MNYKEELNKAKQYSIKIMSNVSYGKDMGQTPPKPPK